MHRPVGEQVQLQGFPVRIGILGETLAVRFGALVPGAQLSAGPGPYKHANQIEAVRKGALDVSRARAELGWAPKYDMRAGLAAYLGALRD